MNETIKLINERKASEILGVSVHTMRAWRIQGKGVSFRKLGSRVLYCENECKRFVEGLPVQQSTAENGER